MSVIFDSLSCQWKDVKNFITVSEFSNTTIKQFIVMSEDEVLKLQEKSSNRQWKSFAIAINIILFQVLVAFLLIQVYQQKQEIENLKAIKARYHYLSIYLKGELYLFPLLNGKIYKSRIWIRIQNLIQLKFSRKKMSKNLICRYF